MKHEWATLNEQESLKILRRERIMHLAGTTPDGRPLIRPLHYTLVDDDSAVIFHSAPTGEKIEAVGREVVCSVSEHIIDTPSSFTGSGPACKATALYRSVQFRGLLENVVDIAEIRRYLHDLMQTHEPDKGWHLPAEPRGVAILRVKLGEMTGKARLLQNRKAAERESMLVSLWGRGEESDLRAIDAILETNPDTPVPPFLQAPDGCRLLCAPAPAHADQAAILLANRYWTKEDGFTVLRDAQLNCPAWLVAVADDTDELIGTIRAGSDSQRQAWILDLVVADTWRKRGLGSVLMRALLDHPRVRQTGRIGLATRDAQAFCERFGFKRDSVAASGSIRMSLKRRNQ
ncbi:MAG: GNAT family N-acetyltransferase [bacterium]|nr:GNAT family N-acetyltransferase [bacterium]